MLKTLRDALAAVASTAGDLWEKGWAERNAGNISINLTGIKEPLLKRQSKAVDLPLTKTYPSLAGMLFLVTCTGKKMRDCVTDPKDGLCVIRLNNKGSGYKIIWQGDPHSRPTSELNSHLRIHELLIKKGRSETTVFHTHPTELIAFMHVSGVTTESAVNRILFAMHPEVKMFIPEGVGFVPFRLPGSTALEEATVKALVNHRVALWEKHGVFGVGTDPVDAFDRVDLLNKSAAIFLLCRSSGRPVKGLTRVQVNAIGKAFHPKS